jgi:hypothetical protein
MKTADKLFEDMAELKYSGITVTNQIVFMSACGYSLLLLIY